MASTSSINTGKGKLVIMRGLPGSGKSFKAAQMGGKVFSTDDFWTEVATDGFDGERIQEAHAWNINRAAKALFEDKATLVIIDNTNTKAWEAKPYIVLAEAAGYEMEIVESDSPWCRDVKECFKKNQHNVPEAGIQAMFDRWEYDLTPEKILATEVPRWGERNLKVATDLIQEMQTQKDE